MKLALAGLVVLTLAACSDGDDDRRTILPAVPAPPGTCHYDDNADWLVTCYDWNGKQPDKEVQVARAKNGPGYCFVGDWCFFNCPP